MTRARSIPPIVRLQSRLASIVSAFDTTSDCDRPKAAKLRGPYSAMSWTFPLSAIRAPAHGERSKPMRATRDWMSSPLAIS